MNTHIPAEVSIVAIKLIPVWWTRAGLAGMRLSVGSGSFRLHWYPDSYGG